MADKESHQLIIEDVTIEDSGKYSCVANDVSTSAKLTVEGQDVVVLVIMEYIYIYIYIIYIYIYIYLYIYIYTLTVLVITISLHGFEADQMWYNLESAQYLRYSCYIIIINLVIFLMSIYLSLHFFFMS